VRKSANGIVENYYLDGNQIAFVTDISGNETFHYVYGTNTDQVLAQDTPTGMVWSLADRLGSVDLLTDASGVVVEKRTYDSFGNLLTTTTPNSQQLTPNFRYGYTGRDRDSESGLDYYRARYYDPQVGRFISVDPIGFGAGDTNLYRYVGNSSTMATDPTGLWSLQEAWNNFSQSAQKIGKFWGDAATDAGGSIAQNVSNIRLPSPTEIGQGFHDFGRSWDAATNFWSREFVSPIANSVSGAVQHSVNTYTGLVSDGQRRGGVTGLLEQGVGYVGGTLASVPGGLTETAGDFVKAPVLTTRIGGLGRAVGGVIEIAGGLATTEFGVGILPVVKGIDDFQTGVRQLFTGQNSQSLIHGAVEGLTGSSNLAGFVDAGTGLAANAVVTRAIAQRAVAVADARAFAGEATVLRQNARTLINVAESRQARQGSGFAAFSNDITHISGSTFDSGYNTLTRSLDRYVGNGLSYQISPNYLDKHIAGTNKANSVLRSKGSNHVFTDRETLSYVEQEILKRGQHTGRAKGTERYGLYFDQPIGYRIDSKGRQIPLRYGELKIRDDGLYHVIPRTSPSKEKL
jgi:RHS repeat-associated protein